jgi:hypothetical protein
VRQEFELAVFVVGLEDQAVTLFDDHLADQCLLLLAHRKDDIDDGTVAGMKIRAIVLVLALAGCEGAITPEGKVRASVAFLSP